MVNFTIPGFKTTIDEVQNMEQVDEKPLNAEVDT